MARRYQIPEKAITDAIAGALIKIENSGKAGASLDDLLNTLKVKPSNPEFIAGLQHLINKTHLLRSIDPQARVKYHLIPKYHEDAAIVANHLTDSRPSLFVLQKHEYTTE